MPLHTLSQSSDSEDSASGSADESVVKRSIIKRRMSEPANSIFCTPMAFFSERADKAMSFEIKHCAALSKELQPDLSAQEIKRTFAEFGEEQSTTAPEAPIDNTQSDLEEGYLSPTPCDGDDIFTAAIRIANASRMARK